MHSEMGCMRCMAGRHAALTNVDRHLDVPRRASPLQLVPKASNIKSAASGVSADDRLDMAEPPAAVASFDSGTVTTVRKLPLLTINAGPRDKDTWPDRLKQVWSA